MEFKWFLLFASWAGVFVESSPDCPSGVAVTCLPKADDVTAERGPSGPPGKRGAVGSPGPKGEKGWPGPQGECSEQCNNTLTALQTKIEDMEADFSGKLEKLRYSVRRNCDDVAQQGFSENGIYTITINGRLVDVFCDFETDAGNWLVFQRRESGLVDFYRNWTDYQEGFGSLGAEFWLGLENLYGLTRSRSYELRVDLEDFEANRRYATYSSFSVEDLNDNYRLRLGAYRGDAGDAFSLHNNVQFTTKDRDNDQYGPNCAVRYVGAWWYKACHYSNLNGLYFARGQDASNCKGVRWKGFPGASRCHSLKKTEMKIRPI